IIRHAGFVAAVGIGIEVGEGIRMAVSVSAGPLLHLPAMPALYIAAISPSGRARLKTSTSSILPAKNAPVKPGSEKPPIWNGLSWLSIDPDKVIPLSKTPLM